jgi:hypothetical protein
VTKPAAGSGHAAPVAGHTVPFVGITDRDYSYNVDEQSCSFGIGQRINSDGSSVFSRTRHQPCS